MRKYLRVTLASTALLVLLGAPASGQDLQRPDGWHVRFDHADATEADLEMFVAMPPGWHVTTGPAGTFWSPENTASGDFRIEMEVFLFDPGTRREAFGLFVGGQDLDGDAQEYSYFLLRNGGEYIVKRRQGADAPTLRPWTRHEAILNWADRGGDASVKNVLAIEAHGGEVALMVNGAEVARMPRSEFPVDGIFGFRVNHGLNLHVSRLEVVGHH
jgi:hypothetical protein